MRGILRSLIAPPASAILIAALLPAYLVAALYPFKWDPPFNAAEWRPEGGLSFPHNGLARTDEAPDWVRAAMRSDELVILLRVHPAVTEQRGPARIMTLSRDHYKRNFSVAQSGDALSLRLRTPATDLNGLPQVRVPEVFSAGEWVDLGVFIRPGALRIKVNGDLRRREALPEKPLANWNPQYPLALGNELTAERPWLGAIERATIRTGKQTASYVSPEVLMMPWIFWLVEPAPALVPFVSLVLRDTVVNILGFIPLGFLLSTGGTAREWRFPWGAILIIASVSAGLEVLQLCFAWRTTSINDLICNTLGGAFGVALRRLALRAA